MMLSGVRNGFLGGYGVLPRLRSRWRCRPLIAWIQLRKALRLIRIVRRAATGRARAGATSASSATRRSASSATAASSGGRAHAEAAAAVAVDREVVRNAVHNRTRIVDHARPQQRADHARTRPGCVRADAIGQAELNRKLRTADRADVDAALTNELVEVHQTLPSQSGPDVVGLGDAAQIRRGGRVLPRHRVPPHRHPVDDRLACAAAGSEQNHVVLVAQVCVFATSCTLM
jgi:hypothetical protein